jgi:hypothetical protein
MRKEAQKISYSIVECQENEIRNLLALELPTKKKKK